MFTEVKFVQQFWHFLPNFGCHGNSLHFFGNSDSIFELTNHVPCKAYCAKNSAISSTELKLVRFWLIFA